MHKFNLVKTFKGEDFPTCVLDRYDIQKGLNTFFVEDIKPCHLSKLLVDAGAGKTEIVIIERKGDSNG